MPTSDYYLQFLEEIDASACEVSDWEARFLEDMLKHQPYTLSMKQQEIIRRMAKKYLDAEVA